MSITNCQRMPPVEEAPGDVIWIPAYPGAGSTLMQDLIGAITGLEAKDVYNGGCRGPRVVTCKTHWPALDFNDPYNPRNALGRKFHPSVMLLLRSPATSIPSFFNWKWEFTHRTKRQVSLHNQQAPLERWRIWRDNTLQREMNRWKSVIVAWYNQSKFNVSLIVPYETMIDPIDGSQLLQKVGQQIRMANVQTADDNVIPCIWKKAIVDNPKAKRTRTYEPGFSYEQKAFMLSELDALIEEFTTKDQSLLETLKMYREDISKNLPIDDDDAANGSASVAAANSPDLAQTNQTQQQQQHNTSCNMVPAVTETAGNPLWLPSFPGSGVDLLQDLIATSTGLESANAMEGSKCLGPRVVTCKTQWPIFVSNNPFDETKAPNRTFHHSAILQIRNPAYAMQHQFKTTWDRMHKVGVGFAAQNMGPQDNWRQWRDRMLQHQLYHWKSMIYQWKGQDKYPVALVAPYEELTDNSHGPELLQKVAEELRKANFSTPTDADISCIWEATFQEKLKENQSNVDNFGFSQPQKASILRVLDEMIAEFVTKDDLIVETLKRYREDVSNNLLIDNEQASFHVKGHQQDTSGCKQMPSVLHASGNPVWVPGYPGSGSTILRDLTYSITGLRALDVYNGGCRTSNIVTCKTHWPVYGKYNPFDENEAPKRAFHHSAILLIRNPANAIPSHFNWAWEYRNKKKTHTVQAPQEDWRAWREKSFAHELYRWNSSIVSWHVQDKYNMSLVVPYEILTDQDGGPGILQKIAQEFRNANFSTAEDTDISCIWNHKVVKQAKAKRARAYEPGFRYWQKEAMLNVLDSLISQFADQGGYLVEALKRYKEDISSHVPIDEQTAPPDIVAAWQ